ncbi:hypothetical protein SAMN05444921_103180 [Streptomyces wuyuanensis]|uniref:Uncharacterized protein n=1 Tax=Streptomyces wuyuanensis TaxID=1196353 RepID=A0A1G9Q0Z5_9ACTN|nr:hypothetical protein SAMN05444921_103180 [Streptomyces wuyuanensis]
MQQEHPFVRDAFPDLVAELITLLGEEGEREPALCAPDLRLVAMCDCGDDFCKSIRTAAHPTLTPGRRRLASSVRGGEASVPGSPLARTLAPYRRQRRREVARAGGTMRTRFSTGALSMSSSCATIVLRSSS